MFHVCKITTLNYNEKTHTLESSFSSRKLGYFILVPVWTLGRIKKITSKSVGVALTTVEALPEDLMFRNFLI